MTNRVEVCLNGGLGNQLFQFAAGLTANTKIDDESIVLNSSFGIFGHNSKEMPEIFELTIDKYSEPAPSKKVSFVSLKFHNLLVRLSTKSSVEFRRHLQSRILICLFRGVLSYTNFKKRNIVVSNGIDGHCPTNSTKPVALIGYFQNAEWMNNAVAVSTLRNLTLRNRSNLLLEMKNEAKSTEYIAVHVRRGDYSENPQFGKLTSSYYHQAIDILWNTGKYREIWIYSDDEVAADEIVARSLRIFTRIVPRELSGLETFDLMRSANAYVLANSSFSWWAAALSFNQDPTVIAPDPWFADANTPRNIYPQNWLRLASEFEVNS
jgi:Glycosyl transferase family 11